LGYCFRLYINLVRRAALGFHDECAIVNTELVDEDPPKIFLKACINAVRKNRQLPELLVGPDIPRHDIAVAPSSFGAT